MTKKRFEHERRELVKKVIAYAKKRGDEASAKKINKSLYRMPRPTSGSYEDNLKTLQKAFEVFN